MNVDFSTLTTAADKASAYNSMLSSGMSDAQIRQAATSALGAQSDADWTALQGLATSAKPAASQATQPTGLLATQQPLTIPQSVYQGTPQSKAGYYNQQLSAGYSDAQIRQAAGPQTDTDWTALQGLAGKPQTPAPTPAAPYVSSLPSSVKFTPANSWDAGVYAKAGANQDAMNQIARLQVASNYWASSTMPRADEAKKFYDDAINFAGTMAGGRFDNARLTEYVNSMLSGAWTDMAAEAAGYKGFSYGLIGSNQDTRDIANLYLNNFSQDAIKSEMARQYGQVSIRRNAGNGQHGSAGNEYYEIVAADGTVLRTAASEKEALEGIERMGLSTGPSNILGNRNYDLQALRNYQAQPSSYEAWAASGFDPKNPIYGDPSYGGANGIDTGQGLLADPSNKSAEALAYRKNAAVYGNTPAYQGAGGTTGGATQWSSSGSGAGAGSASNISGPNVTRAVNGVEETIEGRVGNLLKTDTQGNYTNQVVRQAADRAMQQMAGRGLLNSSMAMQAAQEAAIAKAIEIAGPDAQTYFQQGRANQDAQNVFARDDKAYQYDLGKMAYQSQLDLSKLSEQQRFELQKLALTHSYDSTSKDKDYAFTASEAEKDRQARLKEANISVEANKDQSWRFELARLEQQASMGNANAQVVSNAYGNLMENELRISTMDIGEDAKLRLLQQQATTFNNLAEANGSTLRAPTYTKAAAADAQNNVGGAGMLSTASNDMP